MNYGDSFMVNLTQLENLTYIWPRYLIPGTQMRKLAWIITEPYRVNGSLNRVKSNGFVPDAILS